MNAIVEHKDNVTAIVQVIDRAAANPDIDVDKLERLLAMQERILDRQAEADFNAAMTAAQSEIGPIVRSKKNTQTKSNYADIDDLDQVIRPIYTRNGFSLTFGEGPSQMEGWRRVECYVAHRTGHKEYRYVDMPLDDHGIQGTKNKTETHATKSTMTYGRRTLLEMIFNIATRDDDGNGAQKPVVTIDDLLAYNQTVRENWQSIAEIKEALALGEWERAAEAVAEIRPQSSEPIDCVFDRLWKAPTKGGIWTTKERDLLRSDEFRTAINAIQCTPAT